MKLTGAELEGTGNALLGAVALAVIATAATELLWPHGKYAPFSMYYLAVFAAGLFGNGWTGGLAILLSVLAVDLLFIEPRGSLASDPAALLSCGVFVVVAGCAVAVAQRLKIAERRTRNTESQRAAEVGVREQVFSSTLLEGMPGIVYFYNQSGRFLRWNRDFEGVSGYSGSEIATMNPLDFFAGVEKSLIAQRIAEAFEKGQSSVEADFLSKDGSTRPFLLTGRRIQFDGSACLLGMGIDISKRRQAENALRASEARHRNTLDNILEACQIIGFDWTYLYLNHAAEIQNRRPNTALLGNRMPDVWPGIEASPAFVMLRRCMDARLPQHGEVQFDFGDGKPGWFDLRVQPVPEGIFVLSIDITDERRAEMALRELNESLEHQVGERTDELQVALARAESADRLKSAFLAAMSHELRTPLNSILGFTGILLQGMAGPLNPEQQTQLGFVRESARHLLDLINDVLDISKIEAGQLEVRAAPFDLRASIERVMTSVRPMALAKGIALEVDAGAMPGSLVSDKRRVEQILLNLLTNAVKFTDRGKVMLTVQCQHAASGPLPEGKAALCLSVSDTGMGIKPEDLQTLFRPFRQIDSGLSRQHEGTGLGLAICRRLADLLGGNVRVQSVWGEGSVFTLVLPLAAPE